MKSLMQNRWFAVQMEKIQAVPKHQSVYFKQLTAFSGGTMGQLFFSFGVAEVSCPQWLSSYFVFNQLNEAHIKNTSFD